MRSKKIPAMSEPEPAEFKRQVDATKIPEAIRNERDTRKIQFTNLNAALADAKTHLAKLGSMTDEIEQRGVLAEIRLHLLELETSRLYLEIVSGRQSDVSKLSATANERYNKSLEETTPCYGCRNLRQDRMMGKLCDFGWEKGKQAIPLQNLKTCPDPNGME